MEGAEDCEPEKENPDCPSGEQPGQVQNIRMTHTAPIFTGLQAALRKNVPHDMREYDQWLTWQRTPREGQKDTKLPINLHTGKLADITNRSHLVSFEKAVDACQHYSGIGFAFFETDPFCGIDLDDCGDDPVALDRHKKIYRALNSYTEISPSGKGLHIICKAKLSGKGRRRDFIECYDANRYFTMTGDVFHG